MTGDLDELAPLEAELVEAGQLVCPVCRLAQSPDNDLCDRCGADLSILARALREARDRQKALYRSLLDGDVVGALTQLDRIVQLTGPSLELAALRKMIRGSVVPIEIVHELREEIEGLDPASVYAEPAPEADAERAVFDSLLDAPATDEPDEREAEPEPEPAAVVFGQEPEAETEVLVTVSTADEVARIDAPAVDVTIAGAPTAEPPPRRRRSKQPLLMRLLSNPKQALWSALLILLLAAAGLVGVGYAIGVSVAGR